MPGTRALTCLRAETHREAQGPLGEGRVPTCVGIAGPWLRFGIGVKAMNPSGRGPDLLKPTGGPGSVDLGGDCLWVRGSVDCWTSRTDRIDVPSLKTWGTSPERSRDSRSRFCGKTETCPSCGLSNDQGIFSFEKSYKRRIKRSAVIGQKF